MDGAVDLRDRRRLVQRVPPVHRELDDGDVDHAHQRQDRGGAGALGRIVEGGVERDVAEIEEEQHQHRGEPRVPHPPGAPHRLPPERAAQERDEGEGGAHRGARLRHQVRQRMPPDEAGRAAERDHDVDEERHPRRRHVDEDDPVGVALLIVRRRHVEAKHQAGDDQRRRRACRPGVDRAGDAEEPRRVGEEVDARPSGPRARLVAPVARVAIRPIPPSCAAPRPPPAGPAPARPPARPPESTGSRARRRRARRLPPRPRRI